MPVRNFSLCLLIFAAWPLGICAQQELNLEYDRLGKPYQANIAYLTLEHPERVSWIVPKYAEAAIGNGLNDLPGVNKALPQSTLFWLRSPFTSDPYAELKNGSSHYIVRMILEGGGKVVGPRHKYGEPAERAHEFNRYADFSLHLINVATSKVEKIITLRAQSERYLEMAAEAKKEKYPDLDINSFAFYEGLRRQVTHRLATFFYHPVTILEVADGNNKKVNALFGRFDGKRNKDVIKKVDVIQVVSSIDSPYGVLESYDKIGEAICLPYNNQRGKIYYHIQWGNKRIKRAMDENATLFLYGDINQL